MVRTQNLVPDSSAYVIRRPLLTTSKQVLLLWLFVALVCLGSVSSGRAQSGGNTSATPGASGSAPAHAQQPSAEATGADRCVFCHRAEVEGYARSAMAHSLRRAGQEPDGTVSANGSTITMHSSPSGYWQHWENAGDKSDYRIDFVVGSGTHASGYLANIGGHLFQSPVAYYTSRHAYDLAPGYENQPDPDFTRPIREECVLCHSGTALHVSGTLNEYRSPVFAAEAITCERCHGPAEKHLADPHAGTIINPAKLETAARDSVCEQCHLFGVARVTNPGKKISDFLPGQRLEDVFTTYRTVNPSREFKVISQVEQLALSACVRDSGGRMWCGTCHDPHDKPLQPVAYYRARCMTCHEASFPAAPHPPKDADCLGCHMPRRDAKDGGHSAFTDHRIQRRPEAQTDLPSDSAIAAWREPSPDLQKRNLGIAYIDAGMQRHSSALIIQGYRDLTEVQGQFPDDTDLFKWIGEALLIGKQPSEAKFAFERALELDPHSALAEASAASPYMQLGDTGRAIVHLERAVALDPLDLPAASSLIGLYKQEGKSAEAAALSEKIKAAMNETSDADQSTHKGFSSDSPQKAEEVYKNIRVLKSVPTGELIPAMQFISSSLGVECSFCHVESHFESDDKKPKQTAREMMQMMFAINKNSFAGHREVTCYSCHRGARNPLADPLVVSEMQSELGAAGAVHPADMESQELPVNLPSAAQLMDHYILALGGPAAIEKITSRVTKGTATSRVQSTSVEIFAQSPDKQTIVRHLPGGDTVTTFDGHAGWTTIPGRPARDMQDADLQAARMDADLQFPLHIQQMFPELRVEYPEKIGDREAYVLVCIRKGQPPVKLYFDEQSGLLVRLMRYAESPLGLNPAQTDYADYRDVDGVQIPFRVTLSQPESISTIQLSEVHQNVPIDATKFAKAPAPRHP
jgi:photosynthetic reaction center cytochrome c subunit